MAEHAGTRSGAVAEADDHIESSTASKEPADAGAPVESGDGGPDRVAADPTADVADALDFDDFDDSVEHDEDADLDPVKPARSPVRLAMLVGLVVVVALSSLVGWLGFGAYKARQADQGQKVLLEVGRQAALNLTTIDWQHADADIGRIQDSATGSFYDDFSKRSQPFIDVVKKTQAKSVGTITEAGLESTSDGGAQVLVAVAVKTSNIGAPEGDPRFWRMRITVQKIANGAKVSDVAFVP